MNEPENPRDPVENLLRGLKPRRNPPPQAQAAAFHAVHTAWRRRRWQSHLRTGAAIAATLLVTVVSFSQLGVNDPLCLAVASGGHLHVYDGTGDVTGGGVCVHGETTMLAEATSRVTTADGLEVRLREGTRIRWNGREQVFLETGALHVESRGGGGLVIGTPYGEVRDVGTVFSTDVTAGSLVVSLHEGIVEITSARGRHRAMASRGRGERVTVNAERVVAEPLAGIDATLDWIFTGHPGYHERRADVLLDRIAKDMRMAVKYASPDLRRRAGRTELEGSLDGLGPREALQVVAGVCDFVVEEKDGVLAVGMRTSE